MGRFTGLLRGGVLGGYVVAGWGGGIRGGAVPSVGGAVGRGG